jgi:hypothetical protein
VENAQSADGDWLWVHIAIFVQVFRMKMVEISKSLVSRQKSLRWTIGDRGLCSAERRFQKVFGRTIGLIDYSAEILGEIHNEFWFRFESKMKTQLDG